MGNPVSNNPLRSRDDLRRAAAEILTPLIPFFSAGKAGLHLGDTGAVYPASIADMEAFARPLWAIVPLLAGKCEECGALWPLWREGLINGTDPTHPEYWGDIGGSDQRMVEMAVFGVGLCLAPEAFWFGLPEDARARLYAWLDQINRHQVPDCNWLFFRVMVNTGFRALNLPVDEALFEQDLRMIDAHYDADGWYFDNRTHKDYYNFWTFQYFALIYARVMEKRDPVRCERYRERARMAAPRFARWFDRDGRALPYGRSLTYRFAESAFFAALAFDGQPVPGVEYGVMKRLLLGNLRQWFRKPIFGRDGVLTIGYGYPDLIMGEGYNAPGSPYWGMMAFLVLALPQTHPFWLAQETERLPEEKQYLDARAGLLTTFAPDGSHVQAFVAANHGDGHAHDEAKYEKFCYSTAFGFSVPKSGLLLSHGAYDSMLAFSEEGMNWHTRCGVVSSSLSELGFRCLWRPMRGVEVDTTICPVGEWHIRVHRIRSEKAVLAAEGGYAIRREDGDTALTLAQTDKEAVASAPWGLSGIRAIRGYERAENLIAEPNTNLLYPRTCIPTLHARIMPGETVLICAVLGAVTNTAQKWRQPPTDREIEAACALK